MARKLIKWAFIFKQRGDVNKLDSNSEHNKEIQINHQIVCPENYLKNKDGLYQ